MPQTRFNCDVCNIPVIDTRHEVPNHLCTEHDPEFSTGLTREKLLKARDVLLGKEPEKENSDIQLMFPII